MIKDINLAYSKVLLFPLLKGDFFMKTNNTEKTKKLVTIALFCAIAYVAMNFRINVSFLTYDLKDAFITIAALFLGPISGVAISVIVALLEFITVSDTGPYGLIMNILSSTVFAFIPAVIYKYRRKLSGAILGLTISCLCTVTVMLVANLLITPYYMNVSTEAVIALIPTLLLPFNAIKSILNASLVLLLYKPVTKALKASGLIKKTASPSRSHKSNAVTLIVLICSIILIAICLTFLFKHMAATI